MALLIPSSGISSLSIHRREIPARITPRNRNIRVRVSSSVIDLEEDTIEVLKLRSNYYYDFAWLYSQFSAPAKPTGRAASFTAKKVMDEEETKRNYYVNTGYAIRTLREEFPELFYRELSFDIYRDDIVFKDPLNNIVEYKLDKNGKIYEHRVHNIALNGPQKFQVPSVEHLIQSIGCPSTPKPTYFEFSSSSTRSIVPSHDLSGIKHYLASLPINFLKTEAELWRNT
ncbi:unnamed protein product [Fraxinus pennsylvanica]|uniref:Uncharacterized protein n=1 Tax=Fraxinus pennsylvanica TaxID=56036 RepID=A0AAD1ZAG8_9LAMI|nr:unnamed protein product [Fraxinus pennsylvanica]